MGQTGASQRLPPTPRTPAPSQPTPSQVGDGTHSGGSEAGEEERYAARLEVNDDSVIDAASALITYRAADFRSAPRSPRVIDVCG